MIYFCADDYGISKESNSRIEKCFSDGILNKISVLPNGTLENLKERFPLNYQTVSLHINLVEGYPLSPKEEIPLLVDENGSFRYSFMGLVSLYFSKNRKEIKKEIYQELKRQIRFWKEVVGENTPFSIDSHQHTNMIPFIFQILMKVIKEEKIPVAIIRVPSEPVIPFLLTPSLYLSYTPIGLAKQWLLKIFTIFNQKELNKSGLSCSLFLGAMFSGKLDEKKLSKILPRYIKLAEKRQQDIEIAFHPGYLEENEKPIAGSRQGFEHFYRSPWRKKEFDTLLNFRLSPIQNTERK